MNVELPRDAKGREIPLDTEVLFDKDGNEIEVSCYRYYPKVGPGYWNIRSVRNKYYRQDEVHLNPPDSWEKLEEDLAKAATNNGNDAECNYFGLPNCSAECPAWNKPCFTAFTEDILTRIRKLRGEDE